MGKIARLTLFVALGLAACIVSPLSQARADNLDGSAPLICAFTSATECDGYYGCEASTVEDLNMPQFFKVDFKGRKIVAAGPAQEGVKTETQIGNVQQTAGKLVLQGVDLRGWSMVISSATGKMVLTASGDDEAFVLTGACIAQ